MRTYNRRVVEGAKESALIRAKFDRVEAGEGDWVLVSIY